MVSMYFCILVLIASTQVVEAVVNCTEEFKSFHDCMVTQNEASGNVSDNYSYNKFWTGINNCFTDNKCQVALIPYENSTAAIQKLFNDTNTKRIQGSLCINKTFDKAKPDIQASFRKKGTIGNVTITDDPLPDLTQAMHSCNPAAEKYYKTKADTSKCTNASAVKSCIQKVMDTHSPGNITKIRKRINDNFCLFRKANCSSKLSTECRDKRKTFVKTFSDVAPLVNDSSCKPYVTSNILKTCFNKEKNCDAIASIVNTYDQNSTSKPSSVTAANQISQESATVKPVTTNSSAGSSQSVKPVTSAGNSATATGSTAGRIESTIVSTTHAAVANATSFSSSAGTSQVTKSAALAAGSTQGTQISGSGGGKTSNSVSQAVTGSSGLNTNSTDKPATISTVVRQEQTLANATVSYGSTTTGKSSSNLNASNVSGLATSPKPSGQNSSDVVSSTVSGYTIGKSAASVNFTDTTSAQPAKSNLLALTTNSSISVSTSRPAVSGASSSLTNSTVSAPIKTNQLASNSTASPIVSTGVTQPNGNKTASVFSNSSQIVITTASSKTG